MIKKNWEWNDILKQNTMHVLLTGHIHEARVSRRPDAKGRIKSKRLVFVILKWSLDFA